MIRRFKTWLRKNGAAPPAPAFGRLVTSAQTAGDARTAASPERRRSRSGDGARPAGGSGMRVTDLSLPEALKPMGKGTLDLNFGLESVAAARMRPFGGALPSAAVAPPDSPVSVAPATAPLFTDAVVDQIAARVAERLEAGALGDRLCETVRTTVRETVRSVVSETSERLVQDEIARVRDGRDPE